VITWIPKPYQLDAIRLLVSQGSVGILLDPGMGKTAIALAALRILKKQNLIRRGMLVIAPLRPAYSVWPREVDKWAEFEDLTYAVVHGPTRDKQLALDVDIHITTPEELKWIFPKIGAPKRDWDILCVDESTKFKDTQTKRFKTLRPHIDRFARRWILTGTMVPNGLMDLFGQIYILDLGRALGRYVTHYRTKFFHTLPFREFNYIPNPGAFDEIMDRIDPLVMRLSATEHLDMPDLPAIDPILVDLPERARNIYKDIEDDFITQLETGAVVASNAAVAGGKLRQVCNGALYTDDQGHWTLIHNEKLDALEELLESLSGAPALVMYEFHSDRQRIQERFGADRPFIGGGTSAALADKYISEFNAGRHPILFCHPGSMAHGLNLQEACHHIIWFGLTWNLEYYLQSIARIWRQGQPSSVVLNHRIVVRNSIEERVAETLLQKDTDQKKVYDSFKRNVPSK
jgi:SNF2 family DNA or RNA helicase